MKKVLLGVLGVFLLLTRVYAVSADDEKIDLSKYQTLNFEEILKQEEIERKYDSYAESSDQAIIYLFRGNGCGYCRSFLTFLNSITDEYGKYFKVVGFEVWADKNNSNLLDKISAFMNDPAGGVPYIIIGDQVFPGYAEQYDDGIKSAIVSLYKSSERYDVFEEYNKAVDAAKKAANGNAPTIIFWNFIFILGATITIILVNKKQHRELLESLQSNRKVVEVKEERFEKKEEVKKVKNAKKKK